MKTTKVTEINSRRLPFHETERCRAIDEAIQIARADEAEVTRQAALLEEQKQLTEQEQYLQIDTIFDASKKPELTRIRARLVEIKAALDRIDVIWKSIDTKKIERLSSIRIAAHQEHMAAQFEEQRREVAEILISDYLPKLEALCESAARVDAASRGMCVYGSSPMIPPAVAGVCFVSEPRGLLWRYASFLRQWFGVEWSPVRPAELCAPRVAAAHSNEVNSHVHAGAAAFDSTIHKPFAGQVRSFVNQAQAIAHEHLNWPPPAA